MNWLDNGESLPFLECPKPKGNYTGERLKALRPETYRQVAELLAEPREHVSYREICRRCHVADDTVKAIEKREAIPIATRKQRLMHQSARFDKLAADRVEDQIEDAPLPQAVVTFGVMTDKLSLLSSQPDLTIRDEPMVDIDELRLRYFRRCPPDDMSVLEKIVTKDGRTYREALEGKPLSIHDTHATD
jgi:hypothetical protein